MNESLFHQPSVYIYPTDTLTVPYAPVEDSSAPNVQSSLGFGLLPADAWTDGSLLCTESVGMELQAMPYHPHNDNVFMSALLFCFFLLAFTIATEKHYLTQRIKNIFYVREFPALFSVEDMKSGLKCHLLLSLSTCLLLALTFVDYSFEVDPLLFEEYPLSLLLGLYVLAIGLFFVLKLAIFTLADWVFFDKGQNSLWIESCVLFYSLGGIVLFLLVSSAAYFDLPYLCAPIFIAVIVLLVEILLFYKCFKVFFNKKYGCVYLIVYFCTLELVPCLLVWKTLVMANNLLIINY